MVEVIGQLAPIPYVEAGVGISIKVCYFFGTGVKRFYAFFWDRLSTDSYSKILRCALSDRCRPSTQHLHHGAWSSSV
jgi:hypothetical protein